ncbi:MAG: 2-C-methyl-D-erythritol 4-phosphate cytidylyltransferase [Nocardioidaceae bacterium]|nr:2-C-methyl-D-erythritol 4-phosphate cytidylyltransferase [Nocardioidaceae bacterium]
MTTVLVLVPTLGREHLAFEALAGRPLLEWAVTLAVQATGASVIALVRPEFAAVIPPLSGDAALLFVDSSGVDDSTRARIAAADVVVVHDPLCPLVPAAFMSRLVHQLSQPSAGTRPASALVAVRPVVDTLKQVDAAGLVAGTLDRETVRAVLSPVVATGQRLADIPELTAALTDPALLVRALQANGDVQLVLAPESARRANSRAALLSISNSEDLPI